ncbi:MAG: long-chain fatty acid--CoA ligase [Betaproteobacteria bacterium]|nr:long-chain fatty acid--CoA ligase [Betaproteobacteria bacterium]
MARLHADLIPALLDFIASPHADEAAFNALALRLFAHQSQHNTAYARFCRARGRTPATVRHWHEIPAVPVNAFKELTLSCVPVAQCARVFTTSGTTREVKGQHFHPDLDVWNASMRRHFADCVGPLPMRMGILFPDETEMPHSSLAHYLQLALQEHGLSGSRHAWNAEGVDSLAVLALVREAQATGEPLALLGATYSFVHLMDTLAPNPLDLRLPPGSWLLDTGGFKGRSREVPIDAFYDQLSATFGVSRAHCLNMYGMTELSTQCYDAGNASVPSFKRTPHWMRTRAVDPLTGLPVPAGQPGILVHTDLANFNSVTTLLTEDVGLVSEGGFQLLGRAEGAQAKGCSLAVEDFVQAARA